MYIFSILFISLQKISSQIKKRMNKESKLEAIMFKVSKEMKDTLREEAKKQSKIRGYKVTMTALFAEWVASMRVAA